MAHTYCRPYHDDINDIFNSLLMQPAMRRTKKTRCCKHCEHWKNKQRELDFDTKRGFCGMPYQENATDVIGVLIHDNDDMVDAEVKNYDGTLKLDTFDIVTHKKHSCRRFEKRGKSCK